MGMGERSSLFRTDRWLDTDKLGVFELAGSMWPSEERPPDPKAWRVRTLLTYIKPNHAEAIEDYHFCGLSHEEMAARRGISRQAMSALLRRAEAAFVKAMATVDVAKIPEGVEL